MISNERLTALRAECVGATEPTALNDLPGEITISAHELLALVDGYAWLDALCSAVANQAPQDRALAMVDIPRHSLVCLEKRDGRLYAYLCKNEEQRCGQDVRRLPLQEQKP